MAWIKKWDIVGTSGKSYTVSQSDGDGHFGCSCPAWKFQKSPRRDCQHILAIKLGLSQGKEHTKCTSCGQFFCYCNKAVPEAPLPTRRIKRG